MTFLQNLFGNILSAVGTTSKEPICVDGKTKTYEGRFEIISLVGSLIHKEESHCKVFGGLNVSLSSNGGVFGGQLIDILMAASPVQIVLGIYPAGNQEEVVSDSKESPKEDKSPPSAKSQGKVEYGPKEPSKEDPSPPSTENQEKAEFDSKESSKEDPSPSS